MHRPIADIGGASHPHARPEDPAPIIWEGGHYYLSKGPTAWSENGWRVMSGFARDHDGRMLFVDDIHPVEDVHEHERHLERILFEPSPEPTHLAAESAMLAHAYEALEALRALPKRQKAREIRGAWHCSGFPLQGSGGRPLCLFFDLGLTWYKRRLGYTRAVNVVPEFYAEEQRRLVRLVRKAMPDFELRVILCSARGDWQWLNV